MDRRREKDRKGVFQKIGDSIGCFLGIFGGDFMRKKPGCVKSSQFYSLGRVC